MANKQAETIEADEQEQPETKQENPCLDFGTLRKVAKYQKAMPQAIEDIVILIDELENSGVGYVSTDELKETLLKSFKGE